MSNNIEKFINILSSDKVISYDVETNGLRWQTCNCCGYSVSDGIDAEYVSVRHEGGGNIESIDTFETLMAEIIKNRTKPLVGHNIKFDYHMGLNHKIDLGNKLLDTMSQEALLNENLFSYSLENICKNHEGVVPKKGKLLYEHIARNFGCKPTRDSMGMFYKLNGEDPIAVEYAEGDTISTYQVYQSQMGKIIDQNLTQVAALENELTYVLQKMERKGVKIDLEEADRVKKEIDQLHYDAYLQIPLTEDLEIINVRSGKDLQKYFELCGIDDWPMTAPTERFPDGQPSFRKNFLGLSEEGMLILNARKYATLKAMFLDNLDNFIFSGRIHTNFNQTTGEFGGTKTGRLSSNYPNMQFIPKRDEFTGKIIRKMYIPDTNFIFVEFDYSQAEPRLFSHYSNEPILIEGYNKTPFIDMHQIAAQYMNISRSVAKNLNLGIMYTMGTDKLAASLNIPREQAADIMRRWYKTFRRVGSFTKDASEVGATRGYVRTILGRRARFPDPRYSYRAANRIVQGGSADILKYKMVELNRWIESNKYDDVCQMLLNIHDAILFQIHKDHLHLINEIKDIMEDVLGEPFNLKVPFVAEFKQGLNWSEASYGTSISVY